MWDRPCLFSAALQLCLVSIVLSPVGCSSLSGLTDTLGGEAEPGGAELSERMESHLTGRCRSADKANLRVMPFMRHNGPGYGQEDDGSYQNGEKCFIVSADDGSPGMGSLEAVKGDVKSTKHAYNTNMQGFSFCTDDTGLAESVRQKYPAVNIEEDKVYKIASVRNEERRREREYGMAIKWNAYSSHSKDGRGSDDDGVNVHELVTSAARQNSDIEYRMEHETKQGSIPMHFFRMANMGNLFFNNFLLDNILFRLLRINHLLKYFYSYTFRYSGRGVRIAVIDVDYGKKCNAHAELISNLLIDEKNGFAKNATLTSYGAIECDGSIRLSKLLSVLDRVSGHDILLLPFSGPLSDSLDQMLKRHSRSMVVVAAGGDHSGNSCEHSPNGPAIIKVGSATKNGYPSGYTNMGECNKFYALGNDVLGDSGSSYSAALVASAVAVLLEKNPKSPAYRVREFLEANSLRNSYFQSVLKIPLRDLNPDHRFRYPFYNWLLALLFFLLVVLLSALLLTATTGMSAWGSLGTGRGSQTEQDEVESIVSADISLRNRSSRR